MDNAEELKRFLETCCDGDADIVMKNCEQNGVINLCLLKEVSQNNIDFKDLVPCMGTRTKIKIKLKEINGNSSEKLTLSEEPTNDFTLTNSLTENSNILFPSIENNDSQDNSSYISVPITSENDNIDTDEPPNKYIILENYEIPEPSTSSKGPSAYGSVETLSSSSREEPPFIFNLSNLLEETIVGKAIKGIYKTQKQLDSRCQSYLVELIVQHCINQAQFRRLKNEDFKQLAEEIVKVFPNELRQVYYTAPILKRSSRTKKSVIARGKLVDKYRNKLSFLRKARTLPSRLLEESDEGTDDSSLVPNDEDTSNFNDITWLKNNQDPWSEVHIKWARTFHIREIIVKKDLKLNKILDEFPVIKNPLGHTLIDTDFQKKFPENYQLIFDQFETVLEHLLEIRKKNLTPADNVIIELINSPNVNKESRHFLMLNVLVSLLPSKSFNKKTKTNWHPTANDSKEGLVVQIKIPGDLENAITTKRNTLKKYGLPMLPFVLVEAPNYTEIKNIYVSFDSILYKVISVLKGIDVCFQLIHVLNLVYQFEAEHIWMFIQLAMYKLNTKFDNIPNILDIVNKIKLRLGK